MGVWDEFCIVCAGPCWLPDFAQMSIGCQEKGIDADYFKAFYNAIGWTENWVGISTQEEWIPLGKYTDYGSFQSAKGPFHLGTNVGNDNASEGEPRGIAAHTSCVTILKKELGYQLKCSEFWNPEDPSNQVKGLKYGAITEYHGQDFDQYQPILDATEWLLSDPLLDERNRKHIVKLWKPLVAKLAKKREKQQAKPPPRRAR
jgi:hypothetical protein